MLAQCGFFLVLAVTLLSSTCLVSAGSEPDPDLLLRHAQRLQDVSNAYPHAAVDTSHAAFTSRPSSSPPLTHSGTHSRRPVPSFAAVSTSSFAPPTVISPVDYGADPYGSKDSTAAFQLALKAMLTLPNTAGVHYLSDRVVDLGGATLDLQGGDYIISSPLIIPGNHGNYAIVRGTLRASASFPSSGYLLQLGNTTDDDVFNNCGQCSWGQGIQVNQLLLDASHTARGGISIIGVMGAVLSSNYIIAFTVDGIFVKGGHEVTIAYTWLGVHLWGNGQDTRRSSLYRSAQQERAPAITADSNAAIRIIGFDHIIDTIIVFSADIGVYIKGACILVYAVHTWNGTPYGVWFDGDVQGSTSRGSNRILASYLDFSNLIITNANQLLASDNFFLGGGHIVLASDSNNANPSSITGLTISNAVYNGPYEARSIVLDESESAFTTLQDVIIHGSSHQRSWNATGTRARLSLALQAQSRFCIDLSTTLLFPQFGIRWSQLSWRVEGDRPQADYPPQWSLVSGLPTQLAPGDQRGVCLSASPSSGWNATVYLEVDQSEQTQWAAV